MTTRFAPSTSGEAHPGTLLSALLCWLDARSRDDRVILRFENLDPGRCLPDFVDRMRADLAWFGLDWDDEVVQSELGGQHQAALDALAAQDMLYPCRCSRSERRRGGRLAPDGGIAYDNTCRGRPLPAGGWRACREAVRLALPDRAVVMVDEGGVDLSQHPARDLGDPVLLRRDGAVAYHLAAVVDDAAGGVDRVVRGRDLVPSTATHVLIQELLGVPTPAYRHHLLFLEPSGGKLAKLHRSVGASELRTCYTAAALCGFIAWAVGLQSGGAPRDCHPRELVPGFSWDRVARADQVLAWTENRLRLIA